MGSQLLVALRSSQQANHLRHTGALHLLFALTTVQASSRRALRTLRTLLDRHRSQGRRFLGCLGAGDLGGQIRDLSFQAGELGQLLGAQAAALGLDFRQRLQLGVQLGAFATQL